MSEHTLNPPSIKRLERSRTDKVLAGVSAGLGRYFDLTPAVFRLGFVVLTLLGGAGILVYIAAVLIIPKEGDERSVAEEILADRRDHPARVVALGLLAVAVLSLLAHADTWPTAGTAWALVAVAALIFLWTRRGRAARGLLVAVVTILTLITITTVAAIAVAFTWFDVSLNDGVGNRTYAPISIPAVDSQYKLGIGELTVDVSHVPVTRPLHVKAHLGIGQLRIVVPQDARVVLDTRVKAGDRNVAQLGDGNGSGGLVYVNARVGAGHIEVLRAP